MTIFIDTCVVIAAISPQEANHIWARTQITDWKTRGPVIVSDIVYSECAVGMKSKNDLDQVIDALGLDRTNFTDASLFRAAEAYNCYRANGGQKKRILPDFLVGALPEIEKVPLLTSNQQDFSSYFPALSIIHP